MSDASFSSEPPVPFARLWPFPGIALLAILGGWLGYMGWLATTPEVTTALYTLAGVAGFFFLLSLRTLGDRRSSRRSVPLTDEALRPALATPPAEEPVRPPALAERSAQEATPAATSTAAPLIDSPAAIPMNRRKRTRADAVDAGAAPNPAATLLPETTSVPSGAADDLPAAIRAEQAAREEALAKLERDLLAKLEGVRAEALSRDPVGAAAPDGPVAAFLRKDEFNAAINQRLLPNIDKRIETRVAALSTEGAGRESGGRTGRLREEVAAAKALAEKALAASQAETGDALSQSLRAMIADDRERLATLERTLTERVGALETQITETGARADERLAATAAVVEEVRTAVSAMTDHAARMGAHYQDLLSRVESLSEGLAKGDAGGEADGLRGALATIIEQNKEIRAEQERLAARLTPAGDAAV